MEYEEILEDTENQKILDKEEIIKILSKRQFDENERSTEKHYKELPSTTGKINKYVILYLWIL